MNIRETSLPVSGRNRMTAAGGIESLAMIAGDIVRTRGFNRLLGSLLPGIVEQWAGRNIVKRFLAKIVGRSIRKSYVNKKQTAGELSDLLNEPAFLEKLGAGLPSLAEELMGLAASLTAGIEKLPQQDKMKLIDRLFARPGRGHAGEILTSLARTINDIHRENPSYFTGKMGPVFTDFVEKTDFGELKEMLDGSSQDIVEFIKMANQTLWEYPAKVVCMLGMVPSMANLLLDSLRETVGPLNNMAPDLLADVVLSLMREVDGRRVGRLVNELSELVRKIHTGSTLIGEMGKPQFPVEVSRLVAGTLGTLDVNLLLKARSLLAEIRELSLVMFINLLEKSPELAKDFFQNQFRGIVAGIRSWSRKAEAFETLFTDEEIAAEFAMGMREIDAQQLADTVNRLCAHMNNARKLSPGVIRNTLGQFAASIDSREAGETVRWLAEDVIASFKPIAPEIMPPLLRAAADLISPIGNEHSKEMEDAIATFRKALLGGEVAI